MEATESNSRQQTKFTIKYHETINIRTEAKEKHKNEAKDSVSPKADNVIGKLDLKGKAKYKSIDIAQISSARYSCKNQKIEINRQSPLTQRQRTQPNIKKEQSQKFKPIVRQKYRSMSQENKKQCQKVPLEYSQQVGWSGAKGRLVYRGHVPRNSYFMSNMKECDEDEILDQNPKPFYENDLQFNSRFQSGNLDAALRISKYQYWLFMRQDTNTFGLRQWFFFEVVSNRIMNVTFRVYKYNKKYSLYRHGMKPYIKQLGANWQQKGENVGYHYDEDLKCYYLKFNYDFVKTREKVLMASMPPYTYGRLERFLEDISGFQQIKIRSIGKSLGGFDIPLIEIKDKQQEEEKQKTEKKAIIILCRTHPAQTCSSFSLQTIIHRIIQSQKLKSKFDFYIVPMVNPDGVIIGNHRASLTGVDLNRKFTINFKYSDKDLFPEVEAVKNIIKKLYRQCKIELLLDLHGHSAKKNIFAYGEKQELRSEKYLKGHIIPKLLDEYLPIFRYDYCLFQSYKQKQRTARVYFGKKYKINALTFQQSYGLVLKRSIGISDWKIFGGTLIDVLSIYAQKYMENTEEMTNILKHQIQKEQQKLQQEYVQVIENSKSVQISENTDNKPETNHTETKRPIKKVNIIKFLQQQEMEEQNQSQLQSGDEDLENTQEKLEQLRANIFPKVKYEESRRKSLALPDTTIQLQNYAQPYTTILHEQKVPIISRIMKMREKRKQSTNLIDLLTQKTQKESKKSVKERIRQYKIKLPNLQRFLS